MAPDAASIATLHRRAAERFERLVAGIGEEDWAGPTPCAEWDVRALVNHVAAEDLWVPPLLEGRTIAEVGDRFDGDVLGDDPVRAQHEASEAACTAFEAPGAADTAVHVSYGPIPGSEFCSHRLVDQLVHGWDLAAATGQDRAVESDLAEVLWAGIEPHIDELTASGMFGTPVEVEDHEGPWHRALAATGRDPHWQPPA